MAIAALDAGVMPLIATTPPRYTNQPAIDALIVAVNAELQARGLADINFFDGFGPEHFLEDGVHLNPDGQELRAERVLLVLPEPNSAWVALLVLAVLARKQRRAA